MRFQILDGVEWLQSSKAGESAYGFLQMFKYPKLDGDTRNPETFRISFLIWGPVSPGYRSIIMYRMLI